jgi:lipoate-protein ligase A
VEVNVAQCEADRVPILKRYGGGGTVVLHGGCAVVSLGCWVQQPFQNRFYFWHINQAVISALSARWPQLAGLAQDGLSDLVFGSAKVAGTSLFRSRNYLLYQASILIDCRVGVIERYLLHPSREPEYRQGRSHRSFLQGLDALIPGLDASTCASHLQASLPTTLRDCLGAELIETKPEQWAGLRRRAGL